MSMKNLNIVVIGSGAYVCGRGTTGYGTVMPALLEWKRKGCCGDIFLAGSSAEGIKASRVKIEKLMNSMGMKHTIRYFPESNKADPLCYETALRSIPKPATAIIAVPDNLHYAVAKTAIEQDVHALVVKPLAPTLREVRKLVKAQDRSKVYCVVEFHKRLDCANLMLRDALSDGSIGDPLYFLITYSQRKSVPSRMFRKWVEKTNVFQYLGIHYLDIIYFATKALPVRAMALGQKGWLSEQGINAYDSIEAFVEWKMPSGKKFTSCMLTSWVDPESTSAMSDQKIAVIGTKGRFESDQKRRGIALVTDEGDVEEPNPYFCTSYGADGSLTYKGYGIDSIQQFLDDALSVEEGAVKIAELEAVRPTFRQSIVPTAVLEAVNKSLKSGGKWLNIQ